MTIHCEPRGSAKKCWVTGALEVGVYGGVAEEAADQVASGVLHSCPHLQQLVDSTTSVDLTPPTAVTCCQWEGTLFEHKTVFSSPLP